MGRSELLAAHRALLERWRDTHNLVGPGPVDVHYDDARAGLEGLDPTGRWADLGTGAGFPGVVLAAMFPELSVDLVDSRSKRCAFLDRVLADARCDPGVRVVEGRIEDLPAGTYDGITARALAAPEEVLRLATPLVKPGGHALIFLQADQPAPVVDGWSLVGERPYVVEGKARRTVSLVREP